MKELHCSFYNKKDTKKNEKDAPTLHIKEYQQEIQQQYYFKYERERERERKKTHDHYAQKY